jgi:hypothetical protein
MQRDGEMKNIEQKAHFFLDIFFICLFLTFFIWTLVDYRMVSVYVRGIFVFLGFAFIYSKGLKDFSFIEKALYWVSQNVTVPRTKYNHIFGGLFLLLLAILSFLFPPGHGSNENAKLLWGSLIRDPSFWMSVIILLVFNLLVGFYMFKNKAKRD